MTDKLLILSSISALALGAALFAAGHRLGGSAAEAGGKAALNALRAEYAEEQRRTADAYGKAVADALAKYRKEVAKGVELTGKIQAADKAHAVETAALKRKLGVIGHRGAKRGGPFRGMRNPVLCLRGGREGKQGRGQS